MVKIDINDTGDRIRIDIDKIIPDEDKKLGKLGRRLERQMAGKEVMQRWEQTIATAELTDKELEELSLSMGEHINHIRDEGRGL